MKSADGHDLTTLPDIFLAYPNKAATVDSMTSLAEELRDCGAEVTSWQELTNPGFLFDPIGAAIEEKGLILAETTHGNPNVLFELGYAIAKAKATFALRDESVAKPLRLRPLEIVRRIGYWQRKDVIDFLAEVELEGPSLAEQFGFEVTSGNRGGLYFIPSRHGGGDLNEAIWRACDESPFSARTVDKNDGDYDSLISQAKSIAAADLFVTLLFSKEKKGYWENNAELMLYSGIAAGMGKDLIVLVEQPHRRLVDLGDRVIDFESETEAAVRLNGWLKRTASARLASPAPQRAIKVKRESTLAGLFLGNLDARSDFDLADYFIHTPEYTQAQAGQRHLFVGSKGSGKTANFETLRDEFEGRNKVLVTIAPADFEFPRLASVFDEHLALAHWEFVYGSFWRFIFITEILREIRSTFLGHILRESSVGRVYARELHRWFDENEHLLSLDFVSRVNDLLSRVAAVDGDDQAKRISLEKTLQTARLYELSKHLKEFARQFEIRILIDDLDRNWSPVSDSANKLIITLLNEIQTITTNQSPFLKPAVFLRKDVFNWLQHNDPEFFKRDPGFLNWTAESLHMLIATRIARGAGIDDTDVVDLWESVFPKYTRGEPTPEFITSRTLLRPRDVIEFCQRAVESAQRAGRLTVGEDDVYAAWETSGEKILAQAEVEYQHRYPGLGKLVLAFFEGPVAEPWSRVRERLLKTTGQRRAKDDWLLEAQKDPMIFLEVLYETGIIGVESPGGSRWFESNRPFEDVVETLAEDFTVLLHPAFHRYLRCQGV